jgi:hypothetical protein
MSTVAVLPTARSPLMVTVKVAASSRSSLIDPGVTEMSKVTAASMSSMVRSADCLAPSIETEPNPIVSSLRDRVSVSGLSMRSSSKASRSTRTVASEPASQVSVTVPSRLSKKATPATLAPASMAPITAWVKSSSSVSPPTLTVTEAVLGPVSGSPLRVME